MDQLVGLYAELAKAVRPKVAASGLPVDQLVGLYAELAKAVRPLVLPRLAPDPDDDVVITTGVAAKAEFVVTGDRTLLSIAKYQSTRIISVLSRLGDHWLIG